MDILSTLRQPLSMSMFRNSDDLFAEMALQRQLAATEIESLRSRAEKAEAEAEAMRKKAISNARERNAAEATCEKLAKALESIIDETVCQETSYDDFEGIKEIARIPLSEYRKEASE